MCRKVIKAVRFLLSISKLLPRQVRIRKLESVDYFQALGMFSESAASGRVLAVEECRHQFTWNKWNCSHSSVALFNDNAFPTGAP